MEVKINNNTTVTVEQKITVIRSQESQGKVLEKISYINNEKIFGCELSYIKFFNVRGLLTFILIGVIGSAGYYAYEVYYTENDANFIIVGAIAVVFIIIGFLKAFSKKRHLVIVSEQDSGAAMSKARFSFPVSKVIKDKDLEELMYELVI